jgi:tetratricopeptide (TPR) repeat protein
MWRAVPCALGLLLLIAPAAEAQKRHPSLVVEENYRKALEDLSRGSLPEAVDRAVLLETGTSEDCLRAIERRTAELFTTREPESIVAQAYLRLGIRQARYSSRGASRKIFAFERFSLRSLEDLVEMYVASSQETEAPSVAAGLLTYMAHGLASLRSPQRLEVAGGLAEAALALDERHVTARLLLAVSLELRGLDGRSVRHMDQLVSLEPGNPRFRMRQAVVAAKAGQLERAEELLRELTADDSEWVRDLATQELARLLVADGRREEATALLRGGLRELPREKISLQLAALLDPRWADSGEVLGEWLAEPDADAGPSARWIYEGSARVEIDALREELGSALADRLGRLANGLRRLPDPADSHREIVSGCR